MRQLPAHTCYAGFECRIYGHGTATPRGKKSNYLTAPSWQTRWLGGSCGEGYQMSPSSVFHVLSKYDIQPLMFTVTSTTHLRDTWPMNVRSRQYGQPGVSDHIVLARNATLVVFSDELNPIHAAHLKPCGFLRHCSRRSFLKLHRSCRLVLRPGVTKCILYYE